MRAFLPLNISAISSVIRDGMDVCVNVLLICQYVQIKGVSFRTKFVVLAHGAAAKVNSALPLVGLGRVKQ